MYFKDPSNRQYAISPTINEYSQELNVDKHHGNGKANHAHGKETRVLVKQRLASKKQTLVSFCCAFPEASFQ